jgi:hypothetical protein
LGASRALSPVSLASFPSTLTAATATPVVSVVVRNGVAYYVAQVWNRRTRR